MTQINRLLYGLHRIQTWKGTVDMSWGIRTLCLLEVLGRALNWTLKNGEGHFFWGQKAGTHPRGMWRGQRWQTEPGAFMSYRGA